MGVEFELAFGVGVADVWRMGRLVLVWGVTVEVQSVRGVSWRAWERLEMRQEGVMCLSIAAPTIGSRLARSCIPWERGEVVPPWDATPCVSCWMTCSPLTIPRSCCLYLTLLLVRPRPWRAELPCNPTPRFGNKIKSNQIKRTTFLASWLLHPDHCCVWWWYRFLLPAATRLWWLLGLCWILTIICLLLN